VTVDWFDLGQRLHAAHHRHLVPRLTRTLLPPITHPVAVRARMVGTQVQVSTATPTTAVQTATGSAALTLLGQVGVRITAEHYRTLLTDDTTTGPALAHLARAARADTDAADVAAHLTWWAERADFPGSGAAIDLPATCRTRWITGTTPAAEQHAATWRAMRRGRHHPGIVRTGRRCGDTAGPPKGLTGAAEHRGGPSTEPGRTPPARHTEGSPPWTRTGSPCT